MPETTIELIDRMIESAVGRFREELKKALRELRSEPREDRAAAPEQADASGETPGDEATPTAKEAVTELADMADKAVLTLANAAEQMVAIHEQILRKAIIVEQHLDDRRRMSKALQLIAQPRDDAQPVMWGLWSRGVARAALLGDEEHLARVFKAVAKHAAAREEATDA